MIDDDKDITKMFSELLELMGLDVLANGHNGKDALALYIRYHPEIVFTDIMMPDFDGFYGIEKIKEINPDVKIVAITADVSSKTEQKLKKFNIAAIIYKPFDQSEIKQVLLEKYKISTK